LTKLDGTVQQKIADLKSCHPTPPMQSARTRTRRSRS
jgi:hypothetical protein